MLVCHWRIRSDLQRGPAPVTWFGERHVHHIHLCRTATLLVFTQQSNREAHKIPPMSKITHGRMRRHERVYVHTHIYTEPQRFGL